MKNILLLVLFYQTKSVGIHQLLLNKYVSNKAMVDSLSCQHSNEYLYLLRKEPDGISRRQEVVLLQDGVDKPEVLADHGDDLASNIQLRRSGKSAMSSSR